MDALIKPLRAGKAAELRRAEENLRKAQAPPPPGRFGAFAAPSLEEMPSSASFDEIRHAPAPDESARHEFVDDDSIIELD